MSKKNPYELNDKKTANQPERQGRALSLTEAEKKEKLKGYVAVPSEHWPNIKYGAHIRYIEKSGEFRGGGFILKNPFDTKVKGTQTEKRFFKMQNGFNPKANSYKSWIVAYENVEYVFVKGNGVELALRHDLQKVTAALSANIKKLLDQAKKMEIRVAALEGK
jgi:hypothetical protein